MTQDSKITLLKNTVMNLRIVVRELKHKQEEGADWTAQCKSQIASLEEAVAKLLLGRSETGSNPENEKKNSNALNVRIMH